MEISQKEVDTLKQTLEFFFPQTSSNILMKPTYKMAEGEAADPLIQGIAHAAEQAVYPYILQTFINIERVSKEFKHKGNPILLNCSVMVHLAAICVMLMMYELKKQQADNQTTMMMTFEMVKVTLGQVMASVLHEFDPSVPTRTQ